MVRLTAFLIIIISFNEIILVQVYLEPHQLGWGALMTSWMNKLPEALTPAHKELIADFFNRFMPPLLEFVNFKSYHHLSFET
jgi:hypothetical protein